MHPRNLPQPSHNLLKVLKVGNIEHDLHAGLAVLGASFDRNVRQLSLPTLRTLADDLGTTVSLLVAEGDQQVAVAVIVPTQVAYQLAFHEGTDMSQAMAEVVGYVNRARAFMPPGAVPPPPDCGPRARRTA